MDFSDADRLCIGLVPRTERSYLGLFAGVAAPRCPMTLREREVLKQGVQRMKDVCAEYYEAGEADRPFVIGCKEWIASTDALLAEPSSLPEPPQDMREA